jgi:hypothetical protein
LMGPAFLFGCLLQGHRSTPILAPCWGEKFPPSQGSLRHEPTSALIPLLLGLLQPRNE